MAIPAPESARRSGEAAQTGKSKIPASLVREGEELEPVRSPAHDLMQQIRQAQLRAQTSPRPGAQSAAIAIEETRRSPRRTITVLMISCGAFWGGVAGLANALL